MTKKKRSLDANFAQENNAFAAAVTEAMADGDGDGESVSGSQSRAGSVSVDEDIFETIEYNDQAIEHGDDVSIHSSRRSSTTSQAQTPFGLPVVRELSQSDSKGTKSIKSKSSSRSKKNASVLKKMASVPKHMGRKITSDRSFSSASDHNSVYSEDRALYGGRAIRTRDLSKSNSSTWRISRSQLNKNGDETKSDPRGYKREPSVRFSPSEPLGLEPQVSLTDRTKKSVAMKMGSLGESISSFKKAEPLYSEPFAGYNSTQSPSSSKAQSPSFTSSRPLMLPQGSSRSSTSYCVPMPVMPFETRKASFCRIAMATIFFASSLTFTVFFGKGQLGMAISSILFNNLIVEDQNGTTDFSIGGPPETSNGSHLFQTIRELEHAYESNKLGEMEYHTPKVTRNDIELEVEIGLKPHTMSEEHFIKYVWLRDVEANTIVLAKEFQPFDESPPVLRAKVPYGVTLQPYIYCTMHHLWKGDTYKVPELN